MFEYSLSLRGLADGLDLIVVLDVDDQARDKGAQDLGDNVSDCLQWGEFLEKGSRDGNARAEVTPRHRSTDGNGEDNSDGVGKTNTE